MDVQFLKLTIGQMYLLDLVTVLEHSLVSSNVNHSSYLSPAEI